MMNSSERVVMALNHQEPDRVPLDFGGTLGSGMHVSTVYCLRQALGLDGPGTLVKVVEPYQMLGEVAADLIDAPGFRWLFAGQVGSYWRLPCPARNRVHSIVGIFDSKGD